ncbi:MAG: hypothetical protein ACTSO7_14075 [Candidatus Heimdallarchaeota archaeon]
MSEDSSEPKKMDFRRIALIAIVINCVILIPLVSVILANVSNNAVIITTIVFFGTLIAISFTAIIYDLIILLKNRKKNQIKDE